MENKNRLIITPKTKVLELIETYPELEEELIGYVPAFKKLKNPVLRKTVAKIATLQQASAIGGVPVEELVNLLRTKIGQDLISAENENRYKREKPEWYNKENIHAELNISEMLEAGEQPVNQAIADLKNLPEGKIYKLKAPFLPAPLIDKATSLGYKHWVDQNREIFYIYFYR